MGTKNNPGEFDCYANALPDEPMFILLARDPQSPHRVEEWANTRMRNIKNGIRPKSDIPMIEQARKCAREMREWRKQNDGAWRKGPNI